ncbi:MAG: acyl-CoA reductase [Psychroflexus sp.]
MSLEAKKKGLKQLQDFLNKYLTAFNKDELHGEFQVFYDDIILKSKQHNAWFTIKNMHEAIRSWADALSEENINIWLKPYDLNNVNKKKVAIISAGNVPLVGFHDCLSVFMTGHDLILKYSSKDQFLTPYFLKFLQNTGAFDSKLEMTDKQISDFDAVIATGSNNTSRYFEYYFKNKPNIIRKNRNSVAVLSGNETDDELKNLGNDIFQYFGLGCRNVSKVFVPRGYDFSKFFEAIYGFGDLIHHHKYANNYDYNKAVYLMSEIKLFDNNFLVLKEDQSYSSPIACLFYEYYEDLNQIEKKLNIDRELLQCKVGHLDFTDVSFGKTQSPQLWDYADDVDTILFLKDL